VQEIFLQFHHTSPVECTREADAGYGVVVERTAGDGGVDGSDDFDL
jgi:hypothetical protein